MIEGVRKPGFGIRVRQKVANCRSKLMFSRASRLRPTVVKVRSWGNF
jgi:hypothetical protein